MPSIALIKQPAKRTAGRGLSDGGTECQQWQEEEDGRREEGKRGGGLRAAANCLLCVLLTIRFWPNNFVPNTKVSRKCCHTALLPCPTAPPLRPQQSTDPPTSIAIAMAIAITITIARELPIN